MPDKKNLYFDSMKRRPNQLPRLRQKSKKIRFTIMAITIMIISIFLIQQWQNFFELHSILVPKMGGTMTEASVGDLKILNPLAPNASILDRRIQTLLFAGLVEYNPVSGRIEPALATFKISDDAKSYTFTIKEAARFSNGKKINSEDVIFTFQTMIQHPNFKNEYLKKAFEYVTITAKNDQTITFDLTEPNTYFLSYLTTPILPADRFKNILIEELFDPLYNGNKHPIGAGPYQLANLVPDIDGSLRVFLRRNEHYFKSKPHLDQIVLYVYPNINQLLNVQQVFHSYAIRENTVLSDLQKQHQATHQYREYVLPRLVGLFFNTDSPTLKNSVLREALLDGIDKEKFIQKNPDWNRIDSFFFFEGVDSWQEPNFNEARRTLRDNDFKIPSDQNIRYKNDQPVTIKLLTNVNPPLYSRLAQQIKQAWETELNLQVQLEVIEPENFVQALQDRSYDAVLYGVDFSENSNALSMWHSTQKEANLSNLTNETVDYLIDEVRVSGAQTDIFQLSQKLEDLSVGMPIATPRYGWLISNEIHNFADSFGKIRHHADKFFGIQDWYMKEQKVWDPAFTDNKVWNFLGFLFGKKQTP